MGPDRKSGPLPAKMPGARGRRTAELLQRRELPGEAKVVLGFIAFLGATFVFNSIYVVISPSPIPDEQTALLVIQPALALVHGALFVGIRRRTAWGYWASVALFSMAGVLTLLGVFLSLLEPDPRTFAGSLVGAAGMAIMAAFWLTPVLLLARARRRYFSPPSGDLRSA